MKKFIDIFTNTALIGTSALGATPAFVATDNIHNTSKQNTNAVLSSKRSSANNINSVIGQFNLYNSKNYNTLMNKYSTRQMGEFIQRFTNSKLRVTNTSKFWDSKDIELKDEFMLSFDGTNAKPIYQVEKGTIIPSSMAKLIQTNSNHQYLYQDTTGKSLKIHDKWYPWGYTQYYSAWVGNMSWFSDTWLNWYKDPNSRIEWLYNTTMINSGQFNSTQADFLNNQNVWNPSLKNGRYSIKPDLIQFSINYGKEWFPTKSSVQTVLDEGAYWFKSSSWYTPFTVYDRNPKMTLINTDTKTRNEDNWSMKGDYTISDIGTAWRVTYNGYFVPLAFNAYSEGKCATTYYFGTDHTAGLYSESPDMSLIDFLVYDPSQLFELENVGFNKETQNYYTQTNINENLLLAALSGKYEQEFLNNVMKSNFPELHSYSGVGINLANTFYYGQVLGMGDILGGQYYWAPVELNNGLDPSEYNINSITYTDYFYSNNENAIYGSPLANCLEEWATKDQNYLVSYDNYFKIRDYVNQFVKANHYFPPKTIEDCSKIDYWKTTHPTDSTQSIEYQLKSGSLKNNGWYTYWKQYQGENTSINGDWLDNLTMIIPNLDYNQWDMYYADASNNGWQNLEQTPDCGVTSENNIYRSDYNSLYNGSNTYEYDHTKISGDTSTPLTVALNVKTMQGGIQPKNGYDSRIETIYGAQNLISGTTYNAGTITGVDKLSALTDNAVSATTIQPWGTTTTDGISIAKEANMIKCFDDANIAGMFDIMVKPYDELAGTDVFYDKDQPNPNFDINAFNANKYDPNNQPYALKSAGEVYNAALAKCNGSVTVEDVLKQIYCDANHPDVDAFPFVLMNMYDFDDWSFDVNPDQVDVAIDNPTGQLTVQIFAKDADHSTANPVSTYTTTGFEQTVDPWIQPSGISKATVGIIVGSCLGGAALIGATTGIVLKKKRNIRQKSPEVKKYKKVTHGD